MNAQWPENPEMPNGNKVQVMTAVFPEYISLIESENISLSSAMPFAKARMLHFQVTVNFPVVEGESGDCCVLR